MFGTRPDTLERLKFAPVAHNRGQNKTFGVISPGSVLEFCPRSASAPAPAKQIYGEDVQNLSLRFCNVIVRLSPGGAGATLTQRPVATVTPAPPVTQNATTVASPTAPSLDLTLFDGLRDATRFRKPNHVTFYNRVWQIVDDPRYEVFLYR